MRARDSGERICDACGDPNIITVISSPYGLIERCLNCTLIASGWTVEQWENHHRPVADWLGQQMDRALEAQRAKA